MFEYIVFTLIFLFLCNWFQLQSFLSIIVGPKYKTSSVDDKWIKTVIKKKTGLSLLNLTIFHDKRLYGMMAGLPFWPKMILSEGLYKSFSKDELEWVILHEAGHCVLWHNLEAFLIQITFVVLGVFAIWKFNLSILPTIISALLLSFLCIQVLRWGVEYVADRYSISRVTNPQGVITAQKKLRNGYKKNLIQSEKSVLRFLLHWNIYPSQRIRMAQQRISQRG